MIKNVISKNILLIVTLVFLVLAAGQNLRAQNWPGVDEAVVERFANEHGRKSWKPLINTNRGDLLLFVFLLSGAIGGFVFGFYWRKLFCEMKTKKKKNE